MVGWMEGGRPEELRNFVVHLRDNVDERHEGLVVVQGEGLPAERQMAFSPNEGSCVAHDVRCE